MTKQRKDTLLRMYPVTKWCMTYLQININHIFIISCVLHFSLWTSFLASFPFTLETSFSVSYRTYLPARHPLHLYLSGNVFISPLFLKDSSLDIEFLGNSFWVFFFHPFNMSFHCPALFQMRSQLLIILTASSMWWVIFLLLLSRFAFSF